MTRLKSWLDAVLSFFYPEFCRYCEQERAIAGEGYICERCREQAKYIASPYCERCGLPFAGDFTSAFACSNCRGRDLFFSSARSAVAADGMVLELIHRYKYKGALWLEPFLGKLLVAQAAPALREGGWDMIVPVPLHPVKLREREFNQAERLARRLSHAVQVPLAPHVLRRVRATKSQTRLARAARAANVERAFAVREADGLQGKRIVLVDDVFTTGATSSACARVLCQAGAESICVWTLARGLFR